MWIIAMIIVVLVASVIFAVVYFIVKKSRRLVLYTCYICPKLIEVKKYGTNLKHSSCFIFDRALTGITFSNVCAQ